VYPLHLVELGWIGCPSGRIQYLLANEASVLDAYLVSSKSSVVRHFAGLQREGSRRSSTILEYRLGTKYLIRWIRIRRRCEIDEMGRLCRLRGPHEIDGMGWITRLLGWHGSTSSEGSRGGLQSRNYYCYNCCLTLIEAGIEECQANVWRRIPAVRLVTPVGDFTALGLNGCPSWFVHKQRMTWYYMFRE